MSSGGVTAAQPVEKLGVAVARDFVGPEPKLGDDYDIGRGIVGDRRGGLDGNSVPALERRATRRHDAHPKRCARRCVREGLPDTARGAQYVEHSVEGRPRGVGDGDELRLDGRPVKCHLQFRWHERTVFGSFGAGVADQSRPQPFKFTNGEPPVLLGHNEGANPVEFLLHALAGCVTTTTVLHATARGIAIRALSTELEGDIDLQGLLGLDDNVPAGYREIRIKMRIEADCSDEQLDDLLRFAQGHSPVCNTVCRPVPVKIERVTDR